MKTQLLIVALISSVFVTQIQGQSRTVVNAINSEISDNLDLRIVSSVFGDSRNLQDFERRLNDSKLQISNLDLNYDGQVDYLRVIESVEQRTHIVIIQAVLNRDIYQDIATIEVEKFWNNNVHIQVVGNSFFYGSNYIYEPTYYYTPAVYTKFWVTNYRPYHSNWNWNSYPSYYCTRNTYPVYRYQYNVNICLNKYNVNKYNYVNHYRSTYYSSTYNKHRSNEFERLHPDYSFSRRNTSVSNRYELDQIRETSTSTKRNGIEYLENRAQTSREAAPQSDYSQNRAQTSSEAAPQRDYSQNGAQTSREAAPQRDYSQNRAQTSREAAPQRDYSQNRAQTSREAAPQRDYSQNRVQTSREAAPQRDYSQNRVQTSREAAPQRDYLQDRKTLREK
jgi:hypothetical protein